MSRCAVYATGWTAQIRFSRAGGEPCPLNAPLLLDRIDSICRRARSLKRFAVRLVQVPERCEIVFHLAAIRWKATDRADAAVLHLVRRLIPEIMPKAWVRFEDEDERGLSSRDSVFADYAIVEEADAAAEISRLESTSTWGVQSLLATTAAPARCPAPLRLSASAAAAAGHGADSETAAADGVKRE